MLTGGGGVHKNLTFATRGGGVQNGQKNADVINERPLNWEGEDIGELLAIPVLVNPAYLLLGLSRDVVTTLVHLR